MLMCMVFWAKAGLAGDWILRPNQLFDLIFLSIGLMNFKRKGRLFYISRHF